MALLDEEICPWQALVNDAHGKWRCNPAWLFAHVLDNISEPQRAAMILAKLNYQVENGGFGQWVDNGYAAPSIHWLRTNLPKMGRISSHVLRLAEMALHLVSEDEEYREGNELDEVVQDAIDRASDKFYELQDEWHKEVYAYFGRVFAVN